jgi:hypothetical protein
LYHYSYIPVWDGIWECKQLDTRGDEWLFSHCGLLPPPPIEVEVNGFVVLLVYIKIFVL